MKTTARKVAVGIAAAVMSAGFAVAATVPAEAAISASTFSVSSHTGDPDRVNGI
jgi:hypothetical protein